MSRLEGWEWEEKVVSRENKEVKGMNLYIWAARLY